MPYTQEDGFVLSEQQEKCRQDIIDACTPEIRALERGHFTSDGHLIGYVEYTDSMGKRRKHNVYYKKNWGVVCPTIHPGMNGPAYELVSCCYDDVTFTPIDVEEE